jgi:acyl-CoA synthetase (AMP-forming)/AMP-acid ligase II
MGTIPPLVLPDRLNAATVFLDHNLEVGRGAKTAMYDEGTSSSYAQVAALATRMGNALLDLGVDIEQRVAMLLLDSPQFAAPFFGAIKIGVVRTPLNTNLRPNEYVPILNESLDQLRRADEALELTYQLAQDFRVMVTERQEGILNRWLMEAKGSGIAKLRSLAAGIVRDFDAVRAAIRLSYSKADGRQGE